MGAWKRNEDFQTPALTAAGSRTGVKGMSAIGPKEKTPPPPVEDPRDKEIADLKQRIGDLEQGVTELRRRNSETFDLCERWFATRRDDIIEHVTADVRKRFEEVVTYEDPEEEQQPTPTGEVSCQQSAPKSDSLTTELQ